LNTSTRRNSSFAMAAAALVALAACGGNDAGIDGSWRAERDTVGDTIVVRTVSGSVWEAPATLAVEMQIGEFEGRDEFMFGSISGLAVDDAGGIYVYDSQVPALRKYASDGSFVKTFGRKGGGPGEYMQSDGGLAVLSGNRIALRDPGNGRITIYSPEGESIETWPTKGGFFTSTPLYVDTAGNMYNTFVDFTGGPPFHSSLIRLGPDGVVRDTIELPDWKYQAPTLEARREGSISMRNVPFTPNTSWALDPAGEFVGGLSTRYAVDHFRPDGSVLRIVRDIEPVPVSAGEKSDEELRTTMSMRRNVSDWKWNGPSIPDTKPPFRRIFVGDDGRVWVLLSTAGERIENAEDDARSPDPLRVPPPKWREPVVFDVFEPDGRYLGQVSAPAGFSLNPQPVLRGDRVWAVVSDELEVQHLTRFRIRFPEIDP
jgi:hypothetical protein